jgi:two-component system C4-dicarboxylate transport response regulator DctD
MRSFPSVLVVDDDAAMCDMVASLLRDAGFDVVAAQGAGDALAALRTGYVGVVISDIRMPGKNGFEFLSEARRVVPSIPVILMTSFGDLLTAERAKREGAFGCLSKPFSREDLLHLLARALPRPIASEHPEATGAPRG